MDYDITVIGGGPGGYVAAIKAAQMGKRVCIVEKKRFGGNCLNEGCIPTKALIKTVNLFEEIKKAGDFGIEGVETGKISVSMKQLQKRKNNVVNQLVNGVQGLLRGNKVTIVNEGATFIDKNTIQAGTQKITSEYFIIATGSEPFLPDFISYEGENELLTSTEALDLDYIPESLAIIGGGVIGVEFAHIFSLLGVNVTVLELMETILPMVDEEISEIARKKLEKQEVVFRTGARVKKISSNEVFYEEQGETKSVKAAAVLMAIGRTSFTQGLGAEAIGIEFDRKAVKTDEFLQTNLPNIYAIGDVNGRSMLAHTASHEGLVAVKNICGGLERMEYGNIPSCIYTEPEISSVGLTEKQAREKYGSVRIGKFPMIANGKSMIEGDSSGVMKVIIDEELGEILGVHILSKHATDMIGELSLAMSLEATAEEIIHAIHPHPTVSEGIPEAFMASMGKAIHYL